jgi:aerobic C4-dicarboxylate transport protein
VQTAPAPSAPLYKSLYFQVLVAIAVGVLLGYFVPDTAARLRPLGDGFIKLIKMMIAPIIFCTIVLGVGSIAKAATVGKVGGLALAYFLVMSTFALAIGLVVGNIIQPGQGLNISSGSFEAPAGEAEGEAGTAGFVLGIIPTSMLSALTEGNILQTLFIALLVGFALQKMGPSGVPVLQAVGYIQALVFRILIMIMWLAPIGAFGAIAAVVGETGMQAVVSLGTLMVAFYITCILFIVLILGPVLKIFTGMNIFRLMRYLAREYLLIVSTSSSETALPRLIAKMDHIGVDRSVVGITVPTGYSFNLDGTAIYLTMAALFVAEALGKPLSLGEQISLLVFMIIASKGAAGVSGAGLATLAAGLQSHRPDLVEGVGLIVGIDRFMSEARALTNFTGNAVATVLIGQWTNEFDRDQAERVLSGQDPFDEITMNEDHGYVAPKEAAVGPAATDAAETGATGAGAPAAGTPTGGTPRRERDV